MKIQRWENFNENSQDTGELVLIVDDGTPTTWYYVNDAITNGLLEQELGLDDQIISEYCESLGCEFDELDINSLGDIILEDFEEELDKLFSFLMQRGDLNDKPSVEIVGNDEDGEEWNLSYFPDLP
jgi:hypothetical protein